MVIARLPFEICSQRFHYRDDMRRPTVSVGLRADMDEWFVEYMGRRPRYDISTHPGHIEFYMPSRGLAALFILSWIGARPLMKDDPAPRPGGDLC